MLSNGEVTCSDVVVWRGIVMCSIVEVGFSSVELCGVMVKCSSAGSGKGIVWFRDVRVW